MAYGSIRALHLGGRIRLGAAVRRIPAATPEFPVLPLFETHRRAAQCTTGNGRLHLLAYQRGAGNRRRDKMALI